MINFKDISIVVQGAIDSTLTPISLRSIRTVLPGATIILSTWLKSNTSKLDFDVLIQNEDPGAGLCDLIDSTSNNVNRQIESTRHGLRQAQTPYTLKIRSDIKITSPAFIQFFQKFSGDSAKTPKAGKYTNKKIVINNLYCADPKKTSLCFHFSDWVQFGTTEDLLNLWDIPPQPEEFNHHFSKTNRPEIDPTPSRTLRYIPEQYIWKTFLEKNGAELFFDHFSDCRDIAASEKSFAENLIIVDYEDFGIDFLKFNPYKFDYNVQFTHSRWLALQRRAK